MRFVRIIGYGILVVSAGYFLTALWRYADSLPAIEWGTAGVTVLVAAMLIYMFQVSLAGMAWHLWLRSVSEPSHLSLAVALFAISQIAKYMPGGIAQHVARVALGRRHGLGTPGIVITITLEQSWALIAGIVVAATALAFVGPTLAGIDMPSPLRLMVIAVVALIIPFIGIWLIGKSRPRFMNRWLGERRIPRPSTTILISCFLLYGLGLATAGWTIDLLARYLLGAEDSHILLAVGVFAVAWVAGFLAPVSPGGVGVREAVLLAGLAPAYGPGTAVAAAISYRVVSSVGDGLAFALGCLVEKRSVHVGAGR